MFSWFKRLWSGDLWRKAQPPEEPAFQPRRPHILILARTYAQAAEYSRRHLPYHEDWRFACCADKLRGYSRATIIKLPGWDIDKSEEFLFLVYRLERGL